MSRVIKLLIVFASILASMVIVDVASADIPTQNEGGANYRYFYRQWFYFDVMGGHHCCSGDAEAESVDAVATLTEGTAHAEDVQYPCCYEPPYVVYYYEGWNSQGQYVIWEGYSDGHWVGTCIYGCGYPYGYSYAIDDGNTIQGATVQAYDWIDQGQGYHTTYHGWSEDGWVHWQLECYTYDCSVNSGWYIVSVGPYPYHYGMGGVPSLGAENVSAVIEDGGNTCGCYAHTHSISASWWHQTHTHRHYPY